MHKLRIFSVGAVMVLALSACTAASTSSSSSSKSQSASSSRASNAASSSYTASATPTPKEQIDAKELIEHPEKAREYNFFTDVKPMKSAKTPTKFPSKAIMPPAAQLLSPMIIRPVSRARARTTPSAAPTNPG